jgi:Tfp pilus assembly protein PilV
MKHASEGLTMVEVLVAIALLATIVILTAQPLISSLNLSGTSSATLTGTRIAQDVLERARGIVVANYNQPLTLLASMIKKDSTVLCQDIDVTNAVTGACADLTGPASPPAASPFMRRLTVTTTVKNQPAVILTLDVRP